MSFVAVEGSVKLEGQDFDAAKEAAKVYAQARDFIFVEDGREVEIAEGAGTIGLELTHYPAPFDAVLVPLGNGALIDGVGAWFKAKSPSTKIIGVVASGAPAMDLSWRSGTVQTTEKAETVTDGISVRVPVPEAIMAMRHTVDDVVQVHDEEIVEAMRLTYRVVGVVLEPAGAVGLAAAMGYSERFLGQCVATLLCGGNLTEPQIRRYLVCYLNSRPECSRL